MNDICDEIKTERARQDGLWGGPEHDDQRTAEDWCHSIYLRTSQMEIRSLPIKRQRELFLHIAALAVAAMEQIDRAGKS
jgi:hypothetical protein